jgi:hypothetical protein
MRQSLALSVAALAVSCGFAQDPEGRPNEETRHYDIRALAASPLWGKTARFDFLSPPGRPGGAGEAAVHYLWGESEPAPPDRESIATVVGFALSRGSEPFDWRERIQASGGTLTVTGPASFHQQTPRVLAELDRLVRRTVEVELSILPSEALASVSSSVLDSAKAERLFSAAKPLATLRTHLRLGSETLFEAVARRAFVKDYDTEVAADTKAFDPLLDVIPDGTRASVRVDLAPDGTFVVSLRGQQVEAEWPARTLMLSLQAHGTLHLPRVWWTSTSASARLGDRGALVVGNDVVPRSVWAVRVLGQAPPKPPDDSPIQLIRIGAATRWRLHDEAPTWRSPNPSGASAGAGGETEAAEPPFGPNRLDRDGLLQRIDALRPEGVAEDARRSLGAGPFVLLAGDPKFKAAASELVTKAIAEALRGYSVEVTYGTLPAEGFAVPDDIGTLATSVPHHARTAAIAGDRVVLVAGQDHKYLKDRDVEIAQASNVDDPIVDDFMTGLSASILVLPSPEGRCAVDLRFEFQELIELVPVPTGSFEVPDTELPRIAAVVGEALLDLASGSWALAHTAPLEGTGRQLVVMIRVTEL